MVGACPRSPNCNRCMLHTHCVCPRCAHAVPTYKLAHPGYGAEPESLKDIWLCKPDSLKAT